jgi:hypothetical protein
VARRIAVVLLAVTAAIIAVPVAASPAAAQYQPVCGFLIDPPVGPEAGGNVVIEGFGAPRNSVVSVYLLVGGQEIFLGETIADDDPDGEFRLTVRIPPLAPGEYVVQVRCGPVTVSSIFTVTGEVVPAPPRPGPLPRTGLDPWLLVRLALILLVAGGFLVNEARKRRHQVA